MEVAGRSPRAIDARAGRGLRPGRARHRDGELRARRREQDDGRAAAVGRGSDVVVAPEALRELGRLVVADPRRHRADGDRGVAQEVARVPHPHRRKLVPEARVPRLGERPLQLTAGRGEPARHAREIEIGRVVALD